MGNIRRIKHKMANNLALFDTKVKFGGCRVFLGGDDGVKVSKFGKQFGGFMRGMISRANCVNMGDMYIAHLGILGRMESGESLLS